MIRARVIPPPGEVTRDGDVFADRVVPGPVAGVPVTLQFDLSRVIGYATVFPDGMADIELVQDLPAEAVVVEYSISYQEIRSHRDQGQRIIEEIMPLAVGVMLERKS